MLNNKITVEVLNEKFATKSLKNLGIEFTEVGKDFLSGRMPVDERTQQPMGILHGGASVLFAESLGSVAGNVVVGMGDKYCVGLSVNANHIKSVRDGFVYGKATPIHLGGKTQVWEIKIVDEENHLVCITCLTLAVLTKK